MALQLILHLHNEEPFVADIDALPTPADNFIRVTNPRKRDGRPIATLTPGAKSVLYPWTRVVFIEVMGEEETRATVADSTISFFREDRD